MICKKLIPVWTLCLTIIASSAMAGTVYFDDFSGDGSSTLFGSAPDIDNNGGGNTWEGGTNFNNDGTIVDPLLDAGNYLPFVPTDGNIYTLEANVATSTVTATSDGWIGVGFRNSGNSGHHGIGGYGWYIIRDRANDANQTSLVGPGASGFIHENAVDPTAPIDVKIILDTTAGAGSWTAEWFLNGTSRRMETLPASASGISHVGISFDEMPGTATITTLGSVGSFELSAVPEPTTFLLMSIGGVLFLARRKS